MVEFEKFSAEKLKMISDLAKLSENSTKIDPALYEKYDVKRGLRDLNGKGVMAGLTEISEINSGKPNSEGRIEPIDGELFYRGIPIQDIVKGFVSDDRFGFEEVTYLLLFGKLPTKTEMRKFYQLLADLRTLPSSFVRDVIMKRSSIDMMNVLMRSVLTLYAYDENPDEVTIANVLRQCLKLVSVFPLLAVYGYHAAKYYHDDQSLIIHRPDKTMGTAENILRLLRKDGEFTRLEARVLDMCLVLHAEHGGGNNSTFTTHVVSSSLTDTYSSMAASLGSLKGPRHGGANVKVVRMMEDMKNNISTYSDSEIRNYLMRLLNKEAFDKKGLVYGMGHAVYSISDPRAKILKSFVMELAEEKDAMEEFELYQKLERLAPEVIADKRKIYKGVSANVDFYSGLLYNMLGIPVELFTPLFAVARISGWSAHRIEELSNNGKIIRPAYGAVAERQPYIPMKDR